MNEDERLIEEALHCADTGNATHWPTAAGYLADEVRRLRAIEDASRSLRAAALSGWDNNVDDAIVVLDSLLSR